MQVKSIAECSVGSILQYFQHSLRYHLSLRYLFCLFLRGRSTQVLLYSANFPYRRKCKNYRYRNAEPCYNTFWNNVIIGVIWFFVSFCIVIVDAKWNKDVIKQLFHFVFIYSISTQIEKTCYKNPSFLRKDS